MHIEHPDFETPENPHTKIWRYIDLAKFLSLLETSSLYFTRSDKFIDPYEGALPKLNTQDISTYFTEFDNATEMQQELLNLFDTNRKLSLINCWYQSEYESDAMWQLYSNNGVSIQSTIKRLKDSVYLSKEDILIGQVKYIDYETEGMYFLNALTPFLFKRVSFEHEKEIRAVIWNTKPNLESDPSNSDVSIEIIEHGKHINTDLIELIESIYVAPTAPMWFYNLIISILKKYNINKPVIHSQLYKIEDAQRDKLSSTNETIRVSKELLDHFYKKDSYRINVETLKQERAKFREFEDINSAIERIEQEINKISFNNKKYSGKEALIEFAKIKFSKKELENLIGKDIFKKIYFGSGKYDTILKDIKKSTLTLKEKAILERKAIFSYSEYLSYPSILLASQFNQNKINSEPYNVFTGFTARIFALTQERGY